MKESIRGFIINNFKDDEIKDINDAINESVDDKEELTLPGLGVFFEILWKNSDEKEKEAILEKLKANLK